MSSSFDSCVREYFDVEVLFLFEETSDNSSLEMQYFLHINAKLYESLSMTTKTNF